MCTKEVHVRQAEVSQQTDLTRLVVLEEIDDALSCLVLAALPNRCTVHTGAVAGRVDRLTNG